MKQLFVELKKTYDSFRMEVLYNIHTELSVPKKLVRLTKLCQNESNSIVRVNKYLSDMFQIRNGLKQGHSLTLLLLPLFSNMILEGFK
jgi:hypothetical protein